MKEIFSMWKNTRMIILVALSAAIYTAGLVPFKSGIVILPGITEVRPANVFPIIFGLMFGPAGAWGSAIGNTIADIIGGTPGAGLLGMLVGFLANFFMGYVPYKLWGALRFIGQDTSPVVNTFPKLLAFVLVSVVASAVCAIIIAWYGELFGLMPFAALAIIITLNNVLAQVVLGPPLLLLLYPRVKRWGFIWTDVLDKEDVSRGFARDLGALAMIAGGIGGLVVGIGISTGLYGQQLFQFGSGQVGQVGVWLSVLPFLLLVLAGSFMLSGRELFIEE